MYFPECAVARSSRYVPRMTKIPHRHPEAVDFVLEGSEQTNKPRPPTCSQMALSASCYIFPTVKWEARAVSAAIDENQTPNV